MKLNRPALLLASLLGASTLLLGGCDKKEAPAPSATGAASTGSAGNAKVAPAEPAKPEAKPDAKSDSKPAAGAAPAGAKKSYTIGVIAKSQSNPVFQAARTGAEDAAKDISAKYNIDVKINWRTPTAEDAQQQAQYVEQLVSSGVNAITISCTDAKVLTGAINAAADKGIPVMTFDSDAPDSKRIGYYGMDDYSCGKQLAKEIAGLLNKKGTIAILGGNQNAPNLQARIRGVVDGLKDFPDMKIKDKYYHGETAPEAVAKLEQVQQANPDITGWVMVGGWPLFTQNALDKVAPSAKVVSVDTLPQELGYVKNGQVQVLLGQKCYGWGYETVSMLVEKVHNGKNPPKVINTFEPDRVSKDNVAEFEGLWDKWLGKKK
jgi:ribose transport system substrate-binding protein